MRVRYQQGYLRLGRRKHGPDCWEFLWWDSELSGRRIRRKAVIATILQYPNVEDAWQARQRDHGGPLPDVLSQWGSHCVALTDSCCWG